MSNENREEFDEGAIERTEPDPDEMGRLEERLEELRGRRDFVGSGRASQDTAAGCVPTRRTEEISR